jgi:hypothetical protein
VRIPLVLAPAARLAGREGVRALRARQAEALRAAARAAGAPVPRAFPRDARSAPLPFAQGWSWSAANTRGAALAAVAEAPLRVDVEALARPRVAPAAAFAGPAELALHPRWSAPLALALWAAKEAALKLAGVGVAELFACRLAAPPGGDEPDELVLEHRGRRLRVLLLRAEGFLLALACARAGAAPELLVLPPAAAPAEVLP